jgi:NhaA family Na+:H+ antiporter
VNDIFMVFFFGIAAKEITEACLPGGSLNPPREAASKAAELEGAG